VTRTPLSRSKGQSHQAALVGCTGRPTWTYSNGHLSICVHDVYRITTCRPGRGAYRGGRPPTACLLQTTARSVSAKYRIECSTMAKAAKDHGTTNLITRVSSVQKQYKCSLTSLFVEQFPTTARLRDHKLN